MIHESPGTGATVVVDHDHEGDGDAADDVECEDALDGIRGEGRIGDSSLLFSEAGLHWYPEEKCLHLRYALGAAGAKYSKQPGNKTRNRLLANPSYEEMKTEFCMLLRQKVSR